MRAPGYLRIGGKQVGARRPWASFSARIKGSLEQGKRNRARNSRGPVKERAWEKAPGLAPLQEGHLPLGSGGPLPPVPLRGVEGGGRAPPPSFTNRKDANRRKKPRP